MENLINIPELIDQEPHETIEIIVKYNGDILRLESLIPVEIEILSENYAIVTLREDQVDLFYSFPEIEYIERPKNLSLFLIESLRRACIPAVQSETGFNLLGDGVIVAIIDSGIDFTHPDFRNEDGSSRILYIWDQTTPGNPPNNFKSGSEYNKAQLDEMLSTAQYMQVLEPSDPIGHGTAVAGIAAGNGRSSNGLEKGVAPNSSIIVVKLGERGRESFARTTELMRALKYVIDKAEELFMPIAVNISFGTNDGSHKGESLFESFVNEIAQRWKTSIVVAAGNEGASAHHFRGQIVQDGTIDIHFTVAPNLQNMYLTLWKNFVDTFSYELISPSGQSSGVYFDYSVVTNVYFDGSVVNIFFGQPTHYTKSQEIYFQFKKDTRDIPTGVWILRVHGIYVVDGSFNIWLPTTEEVSAATAFLNPSPENTFTSPATVQNVISVGGYNADINGTTIFSGRGFICDGIYVKPDLVAPAINIVSTKAGGGYDTFTGTSMAAPFVTGSAALMMQWGIVNNNEPYLFGQRLKAFLIKGANRSPDIIFPNIIWGYGTLCLKDSMDLLIRFSRR